MMPWTMYVLTLLETRKKAKARYFLATTYTKRHHSKAIKYPPPRHPTLRPPNYFLSVQNDHITWLIIHVRLHNRRNCKTKTNDTNNALSEWHTPSKSRYLLYYKYCCMVRWYYHTEAKTKGKTQKKKKKYKKIKIQTQKYKNNSETDSLFYDYRRVYCLYCSFLQTTLLL